MKKDLLIEIFTEDLPARFVTLGIEQFHTNMTEILKSHELAFSALKVYGTPRRLVLHVSDLDANQNDKTVKKTGPNKKAAKDSHDEWTSAALGFAKSACVDPRDLKFITNGKGEFLFAEQTIKGKETKDLIPGMLDQIFKKFQFPKTMKWEETGFLFPRPLRGLLVIFGEKHVPFKIADVAALDFTFGHRFLAGNRKITVRSIPDYFRQLADATVMVNQEERMRIIQEQGAKAAGDSKVRFDDDLLETVMHLVEYPVPQICEFDKKFLALPEPLLVLVMKHHQKYFPVFDNTGKLTNKFLVILNNTANENTRSGNERVITARLKDAEFFIQEDLKSVKSLADYNEKLKGLLQHQKIGTMLDKVNRIKQIAGIIIRELNITDQDLIKDIIRTAELCKSDLVTNVVFEFTELQGVMGGIYAKALNENERVSKGIAEHYKPVGADDTLPESVTGSIISLADKFDTILTGFMHGLKPTSAKDPYQMRRAALGIIKILIGQKLELNIQSVLGHNDQWQTCLEEIIEFFKGRLETVLKDRNITYDEIDSILSTGFFNVYEAYRKISVLHDFRTKPGFNDLIIALKRMSNILKEIKTFKPVQQDLLVEKEEKELFSFFNINKDSVAKSINNKNYEETFEFLSKFKPVVDSFFEKVLVMDKKLDVRENRLGLLSEITKLFKQALDFEKIILK